MKILVALRDGRTVLMFEKRGDLARLLAHNDPAHEEPGVKVMRAYVEDDGLSEFHEVKWRYLNKNVIASVVEVPRA